MFLSKRMWLETIKLAGTYFYIPQKKEGGKRSQYSQLSLLTKERLIGIEEVHSSYMWYWPAGNWLNHLHLNVLNSDAVYFSTITGSNRQTVKVQDLQSQSLFETAMGERLLGELTLFGLILFHLRVWRHPILYYTNLIALLSSYCRGGGPQISNSLNFRLWCVVGGWSLPPLSISLLDEEIHIFYFISNSVLGHSLDYCPCIFCTYTIQAFWI